VSPTHLREAVRQLEFQWQFRWQYVGAQEGIRKETMLDVGAGGLRVVDSAGQVVGSLADGTRYSYGTHAIRVLDDGSPVWLRVTRSQIRGLDGRLSYEGDGCSGTPYICELGDDLVVGTVVPYDTNTGQPAGGTLHYATGAPVRRTPGSHRDVGDGSCSPVVDPFETFCQTAATTTIPVFVPPFSVR
jgi:hypothetical protein